MRGIAIVPPSRDVHPPALRGSNSREHSPVLSDARRSASEDPEPEPDPDPDPDPEPDLDLDLDLDLDPYPDPDPDRGCRRTLTAVLSERRDDVRAFVGSRLLFVESDVSDGPGPAKWPDLRHPHPGQDSLARA
jgi:hypothetical protein